MVLDPWMQFVAVKYTLQQRKKGFVVKLLEGDWGSCWGPILTFQNAIVLRLYAFEVKEIFIFSMYFSQQSCKLYTTTYITTLTR